MGKLPITQVAIALLTRAKVHLYVLEPEIEYPESNKKFLEEAQKIQTNRQRASFAKPFKCG